MWSTYLVARRDYLGYVTAWGFWLGLLFTPVILGVFMLAPALAANSQPVRYFSIIEQGETFTKAIRSELDEQAARRARAALDPVAALQGDESDLLSAFDAARQSGASVDAALQSAGGNALQLSLYDFVEVPPPVTDLDALAPYLSGDALVETDTGPQELFAALIVSPGSDTIQYWSNNLQSRGLIDVARAAERKVAEDRIFAAAGVSSRLIDEARDARRDVVPQTFRSQATGDAATSEVTLRDRAPYVVSIALAFMLWFLVFSVINYLLMGTIEERSNKIFDSLLTSVKLPNLLAGKLLAVLCLSLTLVGFWTTGSLAVTWLVSSQVSPEIAENVTIILAAAARPDIFLPALISFLLGYLMYGSLFLALGSLCDTIQEAQTLMTPLIVMLMAPLFMLTFAINDAESSMIAAMSWVPVFTPFLLILRMPTEPPLWEVLSQLSLMAIATFAILYLATSVYRAGAVHGAGVGDVARFFKGFLPGNSNSKAPNRTQ